MHSFVQTHHQLLLMSQSLTSCPLSWDRHPMWRLSARIAWGFILRVFWGRDSCGICGPGSIVSGLNGVRFEVYALGLGSLTWLSLFKSTGIHFTDYTDYTDYTLPPGTFGHDRILMLMCSCMQCSLFARMAEMLQSSVPCNHPMNYDVSTIKQSQLMTIIFAVQRSWHSESPCNVQM